MFEHEFNIVNINDWTNAETHVRKSQSMLQLSKGLINTHRFKREDIDVNMNERVVCKWIYQQLSFNSLLNSRLIYFPQLTWYGYLDRDLGRAERGSQLSWCAGAPAEKESPPLNSSPPTVNPSLSFLYSLFAYSLTPFHLYFTQHFFCRRLSSFFSVVFSSIRIAERWL